MQHARGRGRLLPAAVGLGLCALLLASVPGAFLAPLQGGQALRGQRLAAAERDAVGFAGSLPVTGGKPKARPSQTAMGVTGVGAKVLQAMSAGLVASVVSAMLAAVTEPIMNRVLVKRMSVKAAMAEMSPALVFRFFTTTISTNLLKFPLFEAVSMFLSLLPNMSNVVRGLIVGFIFTTATLPITNFRYRMSIQTPMKEALNPALLYQAYLPTVVRDMVYAIGRNMLTALFLIQFTGLSPGSPTLMFPVVIGACVISAPFNEIRGFLLQSGSQKLSFGEFFKPINFLRSTSLGALNMGISVATGYYLTPIVGKWVSGINNAVDTGNPLALIGIVLSLDVMGWLLASSVSKKVWSRAAKDDRESIATNSDNISALMDRMNAMESENKKLNDKVLELGGKPEVGEKEPEEEKK